MGGGGGGGGGSGSDGLVGRAGFFATVGSFFGGGAGACFAAFATGLATDLVAGFFFTAALVFATSGP